MQTHGHDPLLVVVRQIRFDRLLRAICVLSQSVVVVNEECVSVCMGAALHTWLAGVS